MSCLKSKPENSDHVWKEIMVNPGMFCWVPISNKTTNPLRTDIEKINVQDVPPPKNFTDIITQIAEEATSNKKKDSLKRLGNKARLRDIVSVDDPKKYPIVRDFIYKRGLKVYGGVAINSYLPEEAKFYTKEENPDYDFFSPDPWNDATDLADIFHDKGYKFVEARAGIHKGTYKVFVDLWPVADITYIPQSDFDRIETKTIDDVRVVSPFKLLESMYKEFSEPYANASRWPKVANREKLLRKWYNPLNQKFSCSSNLFTDSKTAIDSILAKLLEKTLKFIVSRKMLIKGQTAYNIFIEIGGGDRRVGSSCYYALSETAYEDVQELFGILLKTYRHLEITTRYNPHKELNSTTYSIMAVIDNDYHKVCEITKLTSCTPFIVINNMNVVSIDYLLYELFDDSVFKETQQQREDAKCMIEYIEKIQKNYYKSKGVIETDSSPFGRFLTKCKGPFSESIKVEIMNRWLTKKVEQSKNTHIYSKEYTIHKIPHDKVPRECVGKSKTKCRYPCAWNKYIGRCSGIPRGTYRPKEEIGGEYLGDGNYFN